MVFCCKQKTAYEMRISDWSSDVCSSDLKIGLCAAVTAKRQASDLQTPFAARLGQDELRIGIVLTACLFHSRRQFRGERFKRRARAGRAQFRHGLLRVQLQRSEEHTSELQSLMRISYAVFCLKKKKKH